MTEIVYTQGARNFAEMHEGLPALQAVVEHEIEELRDQGWVVETINYHFFSWHGVRNVLMAREGHVLVIDVPEAELDPKNLHPDTFIEQEPLAESKITV